MSFHGFFQPAAEGLRGVVEVPGDKSISHRSILFGAVSEGSVVVNGFLRSADTLATVDAVRALGVSVESPESGCVVVHGGGWEGLREPEDVIDVRNAGTLMRLLPGLVAASPFLTVLTGDESIRRRPMSRVLRPLEAMGARVWGRARNSLPPVGIIGGSLHACEHHLPVASAQVKSCLLLAGLRASGVTVVVEPGVSRDHTERLLLSGGARIQRIAEVGGSVRITVEPLEALSLSEITVPGDFSSAAFLIVAALIIPGSALTVEKVGLNPTRTGLLAVLERMGAHLSVSSYDSLAPEPTGAVHAEHRALSATDVTPEEVPLLIDELPVWALAAAKASGTSRLRGAGELRVKESDRLAAVAEVLRALGVRVTEYDDGLDIVGRPEGWTGGAIRAHGDHRLAMVGATAGLASSEGVHVDDVACIDVSFPGFAGTMDLLSSPEGDR
ncbi:MAG: 3-phosphoshikimate 1-carboxyvinyltransferase [Actinobacteria bacterium]|nr:3-phosphoshikimate 1-carboxyvinyltransferase [Actinomycetota bacterium]